MLIHYSINYCDCISDSGEACRPVSAGQQVLFQLEQSQTYLTQMGLTLL